MSSSSTFYNTFSSSFLGITLLKSINSLKRDHLIL